MVPTPLISTLFPYTTLFRSRDHVIRRVEVLRLGRPARDRGRDRDRYIADVRELERDRARGLGLVGRGGDRKSTRLNSSHTVISYAVFCLKKKKKNNRKYRMD